MKRSWKHVRGYWLLFGLHRSDFHAALYQVPLAVRDASDFLRASVRFYRGNVDAVADAICASRTRRRLCH